MAERICVIGDIHGELNTLKNLHNKLINQYPDVDIYSTVDLIDRGPDSKGVIQFCINNNIKVIRGNHDDMLIRMLKGELGTYRMHTNDGMGGHNTVKSYGLDPWLADTIYKYKDAIPTSHKSFLYDLPYYRLVQVGFGNHKYFINHAGLSRYDWLETFQEHSNELNDIEDLINVAVNEHYDNLLWEHKKSNFADLTEYGVVQVIGHYPIREPQIEDECIMIDLGCGKKGRLGAIILPDKKVIIAD